MFTAKKWIYWLILIMVCCGMLLQYQHTATKLKQSLAENAQLKTTLSATRKQIEDFNQQLNDLQHNIQYLEKQSEQRQYDIQQTLQQHQDWGHQPIPDNIKRLFQSN